MKARAIVINRFGGPEELTPGEIEIPDPGPGELLVRVVACGTNPVDAKIRANGTWAKLELPAVLGYDVSGVVEKTGAGVTEFKEGDEVYYTPEIYGNSRGAYATHNLVRADIVALKPATLNHVEAAAVPLAGGTAWDAVVRRLALRVGETVLIHGGAGGVGSFAVQIAKASGARVLATSSAANLSTLRELGADVPIDYSQDFGDIVKLETGGKGVDAVFDCARGDLIGSSLHVTRPSGRLACILPPGGDLRLLYVKNLTLHGIFLTRERKRLEEMRALIDQGKLRPLVTEVLPLDQVSKAHERLDTGHGRGKVVLRIE
ncbi:MAG: zinc-dependent alcohol dehydrogenase family protein [bacterium]|jgi:NADPH2:quinone reductase